MTNDPSVAATLHFLWRILPKWGLTYFAVSEVFDALHDERVGVETVSNNLKHHGLLTDQEAKKRVEFMSTLDDHGYIFTSYLSKKRQNELFAAKLDQHSLVYSIAYRDCNAELNSKLGF